MSLTLEGTPKESHPQTLRLGSSHDSPAAAAPGMLSLGSVAEDPLDLSGWFHDARAFPPNLGAILAQETNRHRLIRSFETTIILTAWVRSRRAWGRRHEEVSSQNEPDPAISSLSATHITSCLVVSASSWAPRPLAEEPRKRRACCWSMEEELRKRREQRRAAATEDLAEQAFFFN